LDVLETLPATGCRTALVVEDEPLILLDIETILADLGLTDVVGVTSTTKLTSLIGFDVAVVDPSAVTAEDIDRLRGAGIPIVVCSGGEPPPALQGAPISKPFGARQFAEILSTLCPL